MNQFSLKNFIADLPDKPRPNIPIILLERQDSSITWCRDIHKIKNLKAIFKNRILRNKEMNNSLCKLTCTTYNL